MALAIETHSLSKRYPETNRMWRWLRQRSSVMPEAVSHINLDVQEGELFGLLGPNGAGKTTLVKLLCTLILPTSGSARVGGFDLAQSDRVRDQVGMSTGDERSFYWRLSGRQNLEFFAALCNLPRHQIAPRVAEVLAQLGLSAVGDASFQTYSSGMRQRLSIARAILHRPRILFLDEPTRSLDPNSTRQLHALIQDELQAHEGMTIFLTTHRLDEAAKLCQRVGIMHKGRLQAVGTLPDLRESLQARHRYHLVGGRSNPRPGGTFERAGADTAPGIGGRWHGEPGAHCGRRSPSFRLHHAHHHGRWTYPGRATRGSLPRRAIRHIDTGTNP